MSEATLTRTRSVLELMGDYEGEKTFAHRVEGKHGPEMEGTRPYVRLSTEQWNDLGNPTEITVAIWPGDRQDVMEEDMGTEFDPFGKSCEDKLRAIAEREDWLGETAREALGHLARMENELHPTNQEDVPR